MFPWDSKLANGLYDKKIKNQDMKKFLILYKILFVSLPAFAQVTISPGTEWINSGNISVVFNNLDFVNNGTFSGSGSTTRFTGNQNSTISGSSVFPFGILEVAKTNGAKVILGKDVSIGSSINFITGLLDLNNYNIQLASTAYLAGESETTRIIGPSGGYVEITQHLNAPFGSTPGNFGAIITSSANLGDVVIRRGHLPQNGTGLSNSIQRYYSIVPQNNAGLNATLRLKYFEAELNGQNENAAVIYQSNDGVNWTNISQTSRNANANYVEKTGVNSLSLQTLANDVVSGPVSGLVFNAKRKKPTEAELTWTTATETNMQGFEVQRKFDNEVDFTATTFVNTKAPGGNSTGTLSYVQIDPNSYTGTSYYRLKIVDQANNISYSDIKTVPGKVKKAGNLITMDATDTALTTSAARTNISEDGSGVKKITVGPNPNNGNCWFMVSGIEKKTTASLYTLDGRVLKQFHVINLQQQKIDDLRNGIYILKVQGIQPFRIVVQGGKNSPNFQTNNTSSIKN